MALSELTFGPPLDGSSVYLDTSDSLSVFSEFGDSGVDLRDITLTDVETVSMGQASLLQSMQINAGTTLTGLTTISGTLNGSSVDDRILINGDRDFSGVTFTNIDTIGLQDGSTGQQTIAASASTAFGITEIQNFTSGSGSAADIFDYTSALKAGDGTSVSAGTGSSNQLELTTVSAGSGAVTAISGNSSGAVEFEDSDLSLLSIDLSSATAAAILDGVETLLESRDSGNQLTGSSAQVTQGGTDTDMLLVFFEGSNDSVIVRYQETGTSSNDTAADYNEELSVVAILDGVGSIVDGNFI